jgi:hypothetical protein
MKPEDVDEALAILRRWKASANAAGNKQAVASIELITRVITGLTGRKR